MVGRWMKLKVFIYWLCNVRINKPEAKILIVEWGKDVLSPMLFNLHMDEVMNEFKVGLARWGVSLIETGREWGFHAYCSKKNLVLCESSVNKFGR